MNRNKIENNQPFQCSSKLLIATLGIVLLSGTLSNAAESVKSGLMDKLVLAKTKVQKPVKSLLVPKNQIRFSPISTELSARMELSLGQSHLIRLPEGVRLKKVKVEDEKVVQVEVTSPSEVVLYPKSIGSTIVLIQDKSGHTSVVDLSVVGVTLAVDANALHSKLLQILPNETGISISTAADSLILTGVVSDAVKVDKAMALAVAYQGKDKKVINMLQVAAPQQVMLEVKMAEVSKNILDKLGAQFNAARVNGGVAYAIAAGFLSLTGANPASPGGLLTITHGKTAIKVDAEDKDGVVKILAEPNIIAISGQEGSFLAGGKLFIPVPQTSTSSGGVGAITLEEREFGVGLKFTPTVLEDGLINLKVTPEVSELSQSGTEVVAGGGTSVLPSFTVRRVSTTVQLRDGQSFAIAGLIKNNVTETIRRFPILGSIPILGALFRSSEFQNDKTELIFVVTPRLVKPLPSNFALPTDKFTQPDKSDFFFNGKMEGKPAEITVSPNSLNKAPPPNQGEVVPVQQDPKDGFEMK